MAIGRSRVIGDPTLLGSAHANIERAKATDLSSLEHAPRQLTSLAICHRKAVGIALASRA